MAHIIDFVFLPRASKVNSKLCPQLVLSCNEDAIVIPGCLVAHK